MRQFKWIEWNLEKIEAHALSAEEVEAAFDRVYTVEERKDGSYQMFAETSAGRQIWGDLAIRSRGERDSGYFW